MSSGNRKVYRLSLRGNRRINHAIHMAAITQIRHRHSDGRAYYEKKLAEGKTHKEALRSLKRRISDAIYAALLADARQEAAAAACPEGPGGQPGNRSVSRAAGSHPARRLFGQDCECALWPRSREREWRRACGPPTSVWLGSARPRTRLTLESSFSGVPRLRREREYQSLCRFGLRGRHACPVPTELGGRHAGLVRAVRGG
ncbi:MAG TPA: transposase [Actinomycetes bacterium]|nr:transposase [Actinomycetes bacterium]